MLGLKFRVFCFAIVLSLVSHAAEVTKPGTPTLELLEDLPNIDVKAPSEPVPGAAVPTVPGGAGKLWGVTHATTNNTNWFIRTQVDNRGQKRHAIPFVSIHSTITSLQINLRGDNQSSRLGEYTVGDGGLSLIHI